MTIFYVLKKNILAVAVKINDLTDNMDRLSAYQKLFLSQISIDVGNYHNRQHSPVPPPRSKLPLRSLALCDWHNPDNHCTGPFSQTI